MAATRRPILLATDGSPAAAEAAREAIALARALDVPLVAVAVGHVEPPLRPYPGYQGNLERLRRTEERCATEIVAAAASAARRAGVVCEPVVGDGAVPAEICRHASERDAATIVIGASASSTARRLLDGGVASRLLQHAPCPVLIVPSRPAAHAAATEQAEKEES